MINSAADAYENAVAEIERLVALLEQPIEAQPVDVPREVPPVSFESNVAREKFFSNVLEAKKDIRLGDIIQVVGSQRFSTPSRPTLWIFIAPRVRSILRLTCSSSN